MQSLSVSDWLQGVAAQEPTKLFVGIPVAFALACHLIFHYYEPRSLRFVVGVFLGAVFVSAGCHAYLAYPLADAILLGAKATGIYLLTLGTSIVIYRNSPAHPLYAFPGPFLARTSQVWLFYQYVSGRPRLVFSEMHRKYGDVVRVGPNELSFADVNALIPIYGAQGWIKGRNYTEGLMTHTNYEEASIMSQRFHNIHNARRKIWDQAFSATAIASYKPLMMERARQLADLLAKHAGEVLDMHLYNGFYVFDVISDLAFGSPYGLLETGEDSLGVLGVITLGNTMHGLVDSLLWLKDFILFLPTSSQVDKVFQFSQSQFDRRLAKGINPELQSDIFHFFLGQHSETGKALPPITINRESNVIIGAGGETTRTVLTHSILYLAQHPEYVKRLQTEIDDILANEALSANALENAPFLNAVIQESLRLMPPLASGVKRESPGAIICGKYVPPGTAVRVPNYVVARLPKYFDRPDEFRPERWINLENEKVFERQAHFPFLMGAFGCIGKSVSLHESRLYLGALFATFDIKFAPGFDIKAFEEGVKDNLMVDITRPLQVIVTKRKGVNHHV